MLFTANSLYKQHKEIKMKKPYNAPKLTVHGNVEVLTQQGGENFIDVPIGTPANGDVAGS
jgi:hypothetical protein